MSGIKDASEFLLWFGGLLMGMGIGGGIVQAIERRRRS